MKNSGFMKVFKFSYIQSMKAKSTMITLLIFVIIGLLAFPIMSLASGISDDDEEGEKVDKLYISVADDKLYDNIVNNILTKDSAMEILRLEEGQYDSVISELKESKEQVAYLEVSFEQDTTSEDFGISYKVVYGKADKAKEAGNELAGIINEIGADIMYDYYEVSEEQIANLQESTFEVKMYDANGKEVIDDTGLNDFEYWLTYGMIFALVIILSFSGSMVAEGIVGEKANRVIEYIMVTLKPMDLIMGKIFSGIATFITIFGSVLVSLTVSSFLNQAVIDPNAQNVFELVAKYTGNSEIEGLNLLNIIIIILFILAGLYFYGTVSGLCGGMVSKVEEMGEGLKIFTIMLMIGAYLPLGLVMTSLASGSGWGVFAYIVFFLPLSSVFIVPSYLLLGKISLGITLISLVILLVVCILLTWLASRIFGQLLYHNGAPLKVKDIIAISKTSKKN